MSKIIKCDRCGGEIQEGQLGYVSMMQRSKDGNLCGDNPFESMDFCPQCMDIIAKFVSGEMPSRETKREIKRTTKKPVKKKEPDGPKMKALEKAGWSLDKIADEMGCSITTVKKYLAAEQEK